MLRKGLPQGGPLFFGNEECQSVLPAIAKREPGKSHDGAPDEKAYSEAMVCWKGGVKR
jgi:hypothetical protein